jgi:hypothetical protein
VPNLVHYLLFDPSSRTARGANSIGAISITVSIVIGLGSIVTGLAVGVGAQPLDDGHSAEDVSSDRVAAESSRGAAALQSDDAGTTGWTTLVADLGSEEWIRRETADAELRRHGIDALDALRGASVNGNPELAYRARSILDELDPLTVRISLLRIEIDGSPRITDWGETESTKESLVLSCRGVRPSEPTTSYQCRWTPLSDTTLEIILEPEPSAFVSESHRIAGNEPLVSVQDVGVLASFLRGGSIIEHRSRTWVDIVLATQHRRSRGFERPLAESPEALWREVESTLLARAASEDDTDAAEALGILALVRSQGARELFHAALPLRVRRLAGAFGLATLGESDGERELAAAISSSRDEERPRRGIDPLRLAALQHLSELGREEPFRELLDWVRTADTLDLPLLFAAVADVASTGRSLPARRDFVELLLDGGVLEKSSWRDLHLFYLLEKAIDAADPASVEEQSWLSSFRTRLETFAAGKFVIDTPRAPDLVRLWQRAALRVTPESIHERAAGVSDPSSPRDSARFDATTLIDALLSGSRTGIGRRDAILTLPDLTAASLVSDALFGRICDYLVETAESSDAVTARYLADTIADMSRELHGDTGRVGRWTAVLVAWHEAVSRGGNVTTTLPAVGRLATELERWTGIANPVEGDPVARATSAERWRAFSADPNAWAKREEEVRSSPAAPTPSSGALLNVWEFVILRLPESAESAESASTAEAPEAARTPASTRFRVLDARRLELRENESYRFRDRWGQTRAIEISAPPSTEAARPGARYSWNRRQRVAAHTPQILSSSEEPRFRIEWYDVSRRSPRGRYLGRLDGGQCYLIAHVEPRESELDDAAGVRVAEDPKDASAALDATDPELILARYIQEKWREPHPDCDIATFLSVLQLLRGPAAERVLRTLYERDTTEFRKFEILAELATYGSEETRELIESMLTRGSAPQRIQAARLIAKKGDIRGARELARLLGEGGAELRPQLRVIFTALRAWLDATSSDAELDLVAATRREVFLAVEAALGSLEPRLVLPHLSQLLGEDFGYGEALRRPRGPQQDEAIRSVTERARAALRLRAGAPPAKR